MDKKKYLKILKKELSGLDKADRESIVSRYASLIDDGVAKGLSEEDSVARLEPPEKAAALQLAAKYRYSPRPPRKKTNPLFVGLGGLLALVFSLLTFLFAMAGASAAFGAVFVFIVMYGAIFHGHAALFFAEFGAGALILTAGILLVAVIPPMWTLVGYCFGNRPERRDRNRRKANAAILLTAVLMLFVGFGITAAGYAGAGFDAKNFIKSDEIVEVTREIEVGETIDFVTNSVFINIVEGESDKAVIVYSEAKKYEKELTTDENITLKTPDGLGSQFMKNWLFGIFGSPTALSEVTLYLPKGFAGELKAGLSGGGGIKIENIKCKATLDVVSGEILIGGETGEVTATVANGAVTLGGKGTAAQITVGSGSVTFDGCDYQSLTVTMTSGPASGTIDGSAEDYTVSAKVKSGPNNLASGGNGEKKLNIEIKNDGSIDVKFGGD